MAVLKQAWNKINQQFPSLSEYNYWPTTLLCIICFILSAKGITDEAVVCLEMDMPRYMMNGVFLHDLLNDFPITNFIPYTLQYFAKYPALSLGHHPLLPGIALIPFYTIFGLSVFSSRLMTISFMILAAIMWYRFITSIYDKKIALVSSLLFITNPYIVRHSRVIMSEIPTLALMISSAYFFYRYCLSERNKYAWAFIVCSVLSVYSKQTAVVIFPVLIFYYIYAKGFKRLLSKDILIFSIIIILLILPLLPITLKFSQFNVQLSQNVTHRAIHSPWYRFLMVVKYIWPPNINSISGLWYSHITSPVLFTSLISILILLFRRDKRKIPFILWIIYIYFFCVFIGAVIPRHAIFWIPAFCLLPSTLLILSKHNLWKLFIWPTLIIIVLYQFIISYKMNPQYAYGYEEAAKYIVNNWKGDSVLYCSKKDSGYFIFFVRKHDQNKDRIVLRADKILATSRMNRIFDDRIHSKDDIKNILYKFGIAYVVIEDQKYKSKSLEWLRSVAKSDEFILRKSIPLRTNSSRIQNIVLNIYELKNYRSADPNAILQFNVPLMGETINVRFEDLLKNP